MSIRGIISDMQELYNNEVSYPTPALLDEFRWSAAGDPLVQGLVSRNTQDLTLSLYSLVLGRLPSTSEAVTFLQQLNSPDGVSSVFQSIDSHLANRAYIEGARSIIDSMARDAFGLTLDEATLDYFVGLKTQDYASWGQFAAWIVSDLSSHEIWAARTDASRSLYQNLIANEKVTFFEGEGLIETADSIINDLTSIERVTTVSSRLNGFVDRLGPDGMSGTVIDGIIEGATVFLDLDGDGIQGDNEFSTTTNADGKYSIPGNAGFGATVASGGTDLMTGKPFEGSLSAPAGSATVSPLTTLIHATQKNSSSGDLSEAEATVKAALGISDSVDLIEFNPIDALADTSASSEMLDIALAVQKASVQVSNVIAVLANAQTEKTDSSVGLSIASGLADLMSESAGQKVDLGSPEVVSSIAQKAGGSVSKINAENLAAIANAVSEGNKLIAASPDISEMAKAAVVTQGDLVSAVKEGIAGGNFKDTIAENFSADALTEKVKAAVPGLISKGIAIDRTPIIPASPDPIPEVIEPSTPQAGVPQSQRTEPEIIIRASDLGGTPQSIVSTDFSSTAFELSDFPTAESHVQIVGFEEDDSVVFYDTNESDVAFQSQSGNVTLVLNDNQKVNEIILLGIADDAVIYDINSFTNSVEGWILFS